MVNIRKSLVLAVTVGCLSWTTITAFGVNQRLGLTTKVAARTTASSTSASALHASPQRREFFSSLKRAVISAGAVAGWGQSVKIALADESPTTGRIVEVTVANLNGEVGKTGTFKIQLRPEWAPRGVARFEVGSLFVDRLISVIGVAVARSIILTVYL